MYLKNVFFQQIGEDIFCFFLFLPFFFSSFSVLLVFFFFFEKVCVIDPFLFELFLEFLVNPFSLFTFFSRKNQPGNLHFLFLLSPFSVTLLLSTFFLIFYHHFFFHHFSFLSICSSLFAFLLFFSSHLSPFFLYFSISVFLFLFFFSFSCLLIFFLHRRCCVSSFCFNSFFFCLSLLIFISLFSCFFSRFFPSLFFPKKSNVSVVNCLKTKLCLYFLNPPVICVESRVFFLLASSCFLVCYMFSVVAIHHRYFS